jgi:hypothetical protein
MKIFPRFRILGRQPLTLILPLPLVLSLCTPGHASSIDDNLPDAHAIQLLEVRAEQAPPREQCFLYTELVHSMTELAGKQMLAGDTSLASDTLRKVEHYAQLIQVGLTTHDPKRLKNAQMLMHHTTQRLGDYMHAASGDDQPILQATLKRLDKVQDQLLQQVFAH